MTTELQDMLANRRSGLTDTVLGERLDSLGRFMDSLQRLLNWNQQNVIIIDLKVGVQYHIVTRRNLNMQNVKD